MPNIKTFVVYRKFRYPFWGLILYLFSVRLFQPKEETVKKVEQPITRSDSGRDKRLGKTESLMFLHNMLLCIFSFLTCANTLPIVYDLFKTYGVGASLTNGEFEKLYDGPYGYWSHLFYLSKFYEFVDTWIVILRGKRPLFLQVYHHTGAVLGMWLSMFYFAFLSVSITQNLGCVFSYYYKVDLWLSFCCWYAFFIFIFLK
ncbi:GNS1/SUR4 family protein [Reticulomyxa filosa]|uniref:Elongation of fatty acids protein n=1 Tax=Reticulomyxa filosa TaxID=46433 RepID=X6N969_RETFI|nr:GNS1/SUR4 family protein [Reticulomyxa filosa]|eukprot:ETO22438.1 GNS1/SUR4 family protein [Reticulomyxa filosa]